MSTIPYADWVEYIERVMASVQCLPRRILDLACGTGTISLLLARRGYDVVGVDRSQPMLECARRKAAAAGLTFPFICQDATALRIKEKFDLCICLYDSLNYILKDEELLSALRAVRRCLRPGGVFFFDLNSLYSFQEEFFTQESLAGAEVGYQWKSHFDPYSRIADIEMHFEPPTGEPFDIIHRQRAYLVEEVAELLHKARFKGLQLFDAYSLLPPGRYSERIFYLVQKPKAPE